jgi:3-oxoacyl-[acyl-carrier protein] reductase
MNSIPYDSYPEEKLNKIMDINLYAPVEFIKEVSKSIIEAGSGRIVNTASIAGQIGHPDIWYGVSKAGIINATKSFAKLLGSKGIVINAVAPGPAETEMMKVIP